MSSASDGPPACPAPLRAIVEHTDRVYGVVRDLIRRLAARRPR